MLELRDIRKQYVSGSFTQTALDGVSVAFRDNEFVAILGPSGSGKTTLLNVVGGLDHFDSGDLVIDGISTREYTDRDWDSYRNNRIGFVFQSYNLIPHQTVLENVELALTLSGVPAEERRRRALDALERVGLSKHVDKHPSQLSGGQAQRVAIARALVNDPEIVLADEPTGALDSETSVQVMDLLQEVARDRLVVMVTHNPELAERYATRIVRIADGRVVGDTAPFDPSEAPRREAKPARRTSMSFLTALSLSFNNLMTKKGRTLLTAFAGSIGIIGIAAILALANGVNRYIADTEEKMLTVYPLSITSTSMNVSSMEQDADSQAQGSPRGDSGSSSGEAGAVGTQELLGRLSRNIGKNDLASLKTYLDGNGGGIDAQVNDIEYLYDVTPQLYLPDTSDGVVQVNPDTTMAQVMGGSGLMASLSTSTMSGGQYIKQMPGDIDLFSGQYDVLAGRWPQAADEMVVVLSQSGTIPDVVEYELGLRPHAEYEDAVDAILSATSDDDSASDDEGASVGESASGSEDDTTYSYDQVLGCTLKLVNASDRYAYEGDYGVWTDKSDDAAYMADLVDRGETMRVVGIVRPKSTEEAVTLSAGVYYTPQLVSQLMDYAASSDIVRDQLASPDTDVLTGRSFSEETSGAGDGSLDLSSLITVDATALSRAFSFDTSALTVDLSGLDLSGMDLSDITLPTPSAADLSNVDLSGVDVPQLTPEQMQELFPDLTEEQLEQVLSQVQVRFRDGGQEHFQATLEQVAGGWGAWAAANPGKDVSDYLATDEVRQTIAEAVRDDIDTDDLREQLVDALGQVLGSGSDSLAGIGADVVNRVMPVYVDQLASALEGPITAAVEAYFESAMTQLMGQIAQRVQNTLAASLRSSAAQLSSNMAGALSVDGSAVAQALHFNMDEQELSELLSSLLGTARSSYDGNLTAFGYADASRPSEIDIYPIDFGAKEAVLDILDGYNADARAAGHDERAVSWTDLVGTVMSSVQRIVDMISTMLIAFVSISLVVSSIMIAVITYISVLERKKEIGILRALGASKHNISSVFNAETVIEGFVAGVMGVLITLLISIPANIAIEQRFYVRNLMRLDPAAALALVGISVFLTFLAGFIPAKKASRSDPVEALRSE